MNNATLERFIKELSELTLWETERRHRYAKEKANSYSTDQSDRPLWRDMAALLKKEIKRY